jgi:hypothetical protein
MNHYETALGEDSVTRWLDQGNGRLMQAEREPAAPSTRPRLRRSLVARP